MIRPSPKIVAVLQARMDSTRLPGKILAPLAGFPMLELIVRRVLSAQLIDELIVATTRLPSDDAVPKLCAELGVRCFRGATDDCLDRIYRAAESSAPDVVVRLTGDNPAPDGAFVDWVIDSLLSREADCDYVDTMTHGTFPYGLSVEALTFKTLSEAWRDATDAADREHVTKYVRGYPGRFRHVHLGWERDDHAVRLTVDYPADLARMNGLFHKAQRWDVGWRDLLELARAEQFDGRQ